MGVGREANRPRPKLGCGAKEREEVKVGLTIPYALQTSAIHPITNYTYTTKRNIILTLANLAFNKLHVI
jgi:hypothetical protein